MLILNYYSFQSFRCDISGNTPMNVWEQDSHVSHDFIREKCLQPGPSEEYFSAVQSTSLFCPPQREMFSSNIKSQISFLLQKKRSKNRSQWKADPSNWCNVSSREDEDWRAALWKNGTSPCFLSNVKIGPPAPTDVELIMAGCGGNTGKKGVELWALQWNKSLIRDG